MENMNIKDMLKNQDTIRDKIESVMKKQTLSISALATKIDIQPRTLRKFIIDRKDVDMARLLKINRYCEEIEKELS